ncbi:hypothetical protein A3860_17905 [Niastella vici]|uniref:Uncharacterized protein n=1 Tax=Niastella vici TaxID=1703345 RepID=A0A1V9G4G7_9BACT|nr:hypothetical protein [Niastella vici]OQP65539.1 hypothetical protein A3860_17905 [Niastella vici]
MSAIDFKDFEKVLEKEFTDLGFNFQDIKDNGVTKLDTQRYQLFGIKYIDSLPSPADGLYLVFNIKDLINEKPPFIELLSASLFSEMNEGKCHELVKKDYSINREKIPPIRQICNDLAQLLKIQIDLQHDFTQLGFEFVNISRWENISITEPRDSNDFLIDRLMLAHHYNDRDDIGYIFVAKKDNNSDKWHLDSINADVQINTERNIEGVIVVSKEYLSRDGPLPHKKQIQNEVLKKVRIEEVRERFFLNNSNSLKKKSLGK